MDRIPDIAFTIACAGRTRTVNMAELEAALGVKLRGALLRLLLAPTCPEDIHEEGGEGEVGAFPRLGTVTVFNKPFQIQTVRGREGGPGETRGRAVEFEAMALADALDDLTSLAFFRRIVATVPPEIVREAMVAALDVPRRDLRRSRGAYFTAVLRRLLAAEALKPICPQDTTRDANRA